MTKLVLLLLGGLKFGKLFGSLGTLLLSLVVYANLWGWRYAVGFLGLLLVHELGHYVAAKQRGLAVGLPTFIPFVGAWIQLKDRPLDSETQAYVALGGPVAGTIAALATYLVARETATAWLLAVAYSGLFLNLFNLIPISPLDGGRIVAIVSPKLWFLGLPILAVVFVWQPSPLLVVIALMAVLNLLHVLRANELSASRVDVPVLTRARYGGFYLGLTCYLAVMTVSVHDLLARASGRL